MKKIILSCILVMQCMWLTTTPIQASTSWQILVSIEKAENLYLITIQNEKVKVKSISTKLYLPISCLGKNYRLKDLDFSEDYSCLIDSVQQAFVESIDYYVHVDMPTLLKDLNIKKNSYDYTSLDSLTKIGKKIINKLNVKTIINYQTYIETNLNLADLYSLYNYFNHTDFKVSYYFPHYLEYQKNYLLLDNHFYLKKGSKK